MKPRKPKPDRKAPSEKMWHLLKGMTISELVEAFDNLGLNILFRMVPKDPSRKQSARKEKK